MPEKYVIIVAGGSGSRMGSALPKQFLEVNGRPILMRTIEVFFSFDPSIAVILVLPQSNMDLWKELCKEHRFLPAHQIVAGGASRFQSVRNGLELLPDKGLVAIHDGVRPFVSAEVIAQGFKVASKQGNAIVSLPLKESIREVSGSGNKSAARDRSKYRLIQTPQTFDIRVIKKAYEQFESPLFTDDASVVESAGESIVLIEGNEANIKITHPADLLIADAFLKNKKSPI
ncbi:MAG: 2-C-methyl-D-erythritol 4-phosphate cytidylyltransferase [Imperialibacter sp.]|uniref:2-C-methyl-D-erythritol 4-phosphate cytidylyltransferase n=1 Tax=Imperialibacter sp. TaxID=2038411 RepID=UPI0032EE397B